MIEQYVLGFAHFLGTGAAFLNDGTSDTVTDTLRRLTGMTKKGKVWLHGDFPVLLNSQEFTPDALQALQNKTETNSISPALHLLSLPQINDDKPARPMKRFRIHPDAVTPKKMHPDLELICDFVTAASWPDKITTLQIGGLYLADLDVPNELISMLVSRYEEIDLLVYPNTGRVRYIVCN
ncbi:MAG TPA: hypothetical protein VFV52_08765 [Bacilli bacterium]|nr:hypothetical protein [Bacilli bacterium]